MLYVGPSTAPTVRDLLCKTWVISTDQPVRWRHFDMLRSNGAEHIKAPLETVESDDLSGTYRVFF